VHNRGIHGRGDTTDSTISARCARRLRASETGAACPSRATSAAFTGFSGRPVRGYRRDRLCLRSIYKNVSAAAAGSSVSAILAIVARIGFDPTTESIALSISAVLPRGAPAAIAASSANGASDEIIRVYDDDRKCSSRSTISAALTWILSGGAVLAIDRQRTAVDVTRSDQNISARWTHDGGPLFKVDPIGNEHEVVGRFYDTADDDAISDEHIARGRIL
jgi:hypothetical protein